MDDVLTLVAKTYAKDSIGQMIATETTTQVFCYVSSVTRSEWYSAGQNGLQAEYVAKMPMCNYNGENTAVYNSKRYSIYRTYRNYDADEIELYLGERVGS